MLTPSIVEHFFLFWTALAFLTGLANLTHAIANRRRLIRDPRLNGGRRFILMDDIRGELLRSTAQGLFLVIAIVAEALPNRPTRTLTFNQGIIIVTFLFIPLILTVNSVLDFAARRKLYRLYRGKPTP